MRHKVEGTIYGNGEGSDSLAMIQGRDLKVAEPLANKVEHASVEVV